MDFKTVTHSICGHDIAIRIPADPEAVLSKAAQLDADNASAGVSDPYWCLVWDAAPRTARLILENDWGSRSSINAIEIGCGVGLSGIAAQIVGMDVTYSDYSAPAVDQAVQNAAANGFADSKGLVLDWNFPTDQQFEFIFGSDILYDKANHVPVLNVLKNMMPATGEAWIGDMGRYALEGFVKLAIAENWKVELFDESGKPLAKPVHQSFQLLKISAQ
jgi:predicted nicotinamide N-methyase